MATLNGRGFTGVKNLNIKGQGLTRGGIIRFEGTNSANPLSSTSNGFYVNTSNQLIFASQGTTTVIGVAGSGGGVPSWETLFAADTTFNVAGTAFTINEAGAGANDILKVTAAAAGSGNVIKISNAGSGKDIIGENSTWSVTKAGLALFSDINTPLITSSANLTISAAGAGVITIGANSNTITLAKATTLSSSLTVTSGATVLTQGSNTVSAVVITDNTVTTFGVTQAEDAGVLVVRSTSLTTGTLLRLQAVEGTMTTAGAYLEALDTTGANASVFRISRYGATTIAGTAAGTAALTLTTGDVAVSSGAVSITRANDAVNLTITNNTATSASVFVLTGSGVHTGTTTTSFATITASGLTTGTLLRLVAVGATSSVGVVDIATGGLTTGSALRITTATAHTTGGDAIEIDMVASTAGNGIRVTTTGAYTGTGMLNILTGAATSGVLVAVESTTGLTSGSLIRATTATAGIVATNGVISFRATAAYTSTSNAGLLDVRASAITGIATVVNFVSSAASQTVAKVLNITSSGYTTGFTGSVVTMDSASTTGTGNILQITGVATTAGDAVKLINNALTLGAATLLNLSHTTSVLGAGTSMLRITSTGVNTGTTTGVLLDLAATASTTGVLALITAGGVMTTTGSLLSLIGNAATTAAGLLRVSGTGLSSGIGLVITGTSATLTTGRYLSLNDATAEVFGIGANGHIHTLLGGGTAPVMTTNSTGISATAIVAASTDVNGSFTTTGTPQSGTVLTCTFHKTYTAAPKFVVITPLNAAAGNPNTVPYVSSITATTFVLTWPAGGTYAATPSYAYLVIA